MEHIQGSDREQMTLFPEALDDYIARDNPVRFLDVSIDSLDLKSLGFEHVVLKETGRPPYQPADLLKLYVYGYLNRIRSSRRLETESGRNLELPVLARPGKIDKYLEQLDQADQEEKDVHKPSAEELQEKIEAMKGRRARLRGMQDQLKESGQSQISLTDPDSRAMPIGGGSASRLTAAS